MHLLVIEGERRPRSTTHRALFPPTIVHTVELIPQRLEERIYLDAFLHLLCPRALALI